MENAQKLPHPTRELASRTGAAPSGPHQPANEIPAILSPRKAGVAVFVLMAAAFLGVAGEVVAQRWLTVQEAGFSAWVYLGRTALMTTLWTGLTHLHGMIGGLCPAGPFAAVTGVSADSLALMTNAGELFQPDEHILAFWLDKAQGNSLSIKPEADNEPSHTS